MTMPAPGEWVAAALSAGSGYLLGSVSFSWLIARSRGVDLRQVGSGNLGATNVSRALGARAAVLAYALDAAKGFLPAWLGAWAPVWLGVGAAENGPSPVWASGAAGGAAAVAGHVWPFWLRFRGGKGVATLMGAMLALAPLPLLAPAAVHGAAVLATRIMSIGSLTFGLALPAAVIALGPAGAFADRLPVTLFALAAGALLWYTHRANLGRLLRREEPRLRGRGPQASGRGSPGGGGERPA